MMCVDHGMVEIPPDTDDSFLPHVRKCLQVCGSFKIGLDDLKLPVKISKFSKVVRHLMSMEPRSQIGTAEGFKYCGLSKSLESPVGKYVIRCLNPRRAIRV
jgi:hypothetical protein